MFSPDEYYKRDESIGIEKNKQLESNLKKLDLLDFDINNKIEIFVKSEIAIWIKTNYSSVLNSLTLGEIVEKIKLSKKFQSHLEYLKKQEIRATILGTCIYSDFYNLCTEEELAYLGW